MYRAIRRDRHRRQGAPCRRVLIDYRVDAPLTLTMAKIDTCQAPYPYQFISECEGNFVHTVRAHR